MDIIVFNYFIIRFLRRKIDNNDKAERARRGSYRSHRSILMGAHTVNRQGILNG